MSINKKFDVCLSNGFSERNKIKSFSKIIQVNTLNQKTRNKIIIAIMEWLRCFRETFDKYELMKYIYIDVFLAQIDELPTNRAEDFNETHMNTMIEEFSKIVMNDSYSDIMDLIEALINFDKHCRLLAEEYDDIIDMLSEDINEIFKNENVNYRIVNRMIMSLNTDEEIQSIDETLDSPYEVVSKHYYKAINLYKSNDYSNSIKESISSVEAMCQIIIREDSITLGKALKKLKNTIPPAMESAYEKLYGYASDENGIRHSNGIGEGNTTISEAKYMLVSCSAFVNYLKDNYDNGKYNEL